MLTAELKSTTQSVSVILAWPETHSKLVTLLKKEEWLEILATHHHVDPIQSALFNERRQCVHVSKISSETLKMDADLNAFWTLIVHPQNPASIKNALNLALKMFAVSMLNAKFVNMLLSVSAHLVILEMLSTNANHFLNEMKSETPAIPHHADLMCHVKSMTTTLPFVMFAHHLMQFTILDVAQNAWATPNVHLTRHVWDRNVSIHVLALVDITLTAKLSVTTQFAAVIVASLEILMNNVNVRLLKSSH
jgi:hypothetical protein